MLYNCEPLIASFEAELIAPSTTLVMVWLPALTPVLPIETALAVPWLNTNSLPLMTLLLPVLASVSVTLFNAMSAAVAMVKVLPLRLISMLLPLLICTVSPAATLLAASPSLCKFQPWLRLAMSAVF